MKKMNNPVITGIFCIFNSSGGHFKRRWYRKPSRSLFDDMITEIDLLPNRQLEVKYDRECKTDDQNKYSDMKLFI